LKLGINQRHLFGWLCNVRSLILPVPVVDVLICELLRRRDGYMKCCNQCVYYVGVWDCSCVCWSFCPLAHFKSHSSELH